jgi:hypothetical protein
MKRYKRKFEESSAPENVEAHKYKSNPKDRLWKDISFADKKDKDILSKLTPTLLKKGEDYNIDIISTTSDGSILIRIYWINENGVMLGATKGFDSKQEAKNEGWEI